MFADFECSTDGLHKPYCVCFQYEDGRDGYYYGNDVTIKFLEVIKDGSLVYFHNLAYDINFIISYLDKVYDNSIIRNGRVMQMVGVYKSKKILFKDSYSIISKGLSAFPSMFKLNSGEKEAYPYDYYTSDRVKNSIGSINEALEFVKESQKDIFKENVKKYAAINETEFDTQKYCLMYCMQDVRILREGFRWFREALFERIWIRCLRFRFY